MTKEEIFQHRSREMRDGKAYCFVDGRTELVFNESAVPENGVLCEICSEPVCSDCQKDGICVPCIKGD
jgi:hypothetical protein